MNQFIEEKIKEAGFVDTCSVLVYYSKYSKLIRNEEITLELDTTSDSLLERILSTEPSSNLYLSLYIKNPKNTNFQLSNFKSRFSFLRPKNLEKIIGLKTVEIIKDINIYKIQADDDKIFIRVCLASNFDMNGRLLGQMEAAAFSLRDHLLNSL